MAFEKLAPPEFSAIRRPTPKEIAEVESRATKPVWISDVPITATANITIDETQGWPAGTQCQCKRKRKDGSWCGHIWKTRTPGKPNACALCKQTCWDEEPTQRKRHQLKPIKKAKKRA